MLERSGHTLECELKSQDGATKRYKVGLLICSNPTCPCTLVHLELSGLGEAEKPVVTVDLETKAIAEDDAGANVGPQLVAALTDDDWGVLDDGYKEVKARNARAERAPARTGPKIGRNEPCPCGSGKKYKKCCLGAATSAV